MPKFTSRLRFRLFLLIVVAIIPGIAVQLVSYREEGRLGRDLAWSEVSRLADVSAGNLAQVIEGSRQLLSVAAELPAIKAHDSTATSAALARIAQSNPQYNVLTAADPAGVLFASSIPMSGTVGANDRTYFTRAISTRRFAVGDYVTGRLTGKGGIGFAFPTFDTAGTLDAVLTVGLDLQWLEKSALHATLPEGGVLLVFDSNGVVLGRNPDPDNTIIGYSFTNSENYRIIMAQKTGRAELVGADGVTRMYAFEPIAGSDEHMFLAVGVPPAVALAPANARIVRNLILLLSGALLAVALAWLTSGWVVLGPVKALTQAAARLSAGDLSARTGLETQRGELGRLAVAFDGMAASLERRDAQLRDAETSLRTSAEALHESEAKYRRLAEDLPDVIFRYRLRPAPTLEYISPRAIDIIGHSPEELYREPGLVAPLLETVIASLRADDHTAPVEHADMRWTRPDGGAAWLSVRVVSECNAEGQTVSVEGTIRDITWRKETEQALEASFKALQLSETRYRAVVEDQTELICRFLPDSTYTVVNDAFCRFFGLTREAIIGQSWAPSVYAEDLTTVEGLLTTLSPANSVVTIENRVVLPGGAVRWTQWTNHAIFDANGRLLETQAVGRDINDLKEAEEESRRHVERTEILAAVAQSFAETALDYQAVLDTAARRISELLGDVCTLSILSEDGLYLRLGAVYHPDPDMRRFCTELWQAAPVAANEGVGGYVVRTGQVLYLPEVDRSKMAALVKPEHHAYFDRVGVHSLLGAPLQVEGHVIGALTLTRSTPGRPYTAEDASFIGLVTDRVALALSNARAHGILRAALAEREQAEQEVRRLNDELEARVRRRTVELQAANSELEAFSYSISHDLRAPIRAIGGFSNMILADRLDLDAETRRRLNVVTENANRMGEMVDGLLRFSRLGRQSIEMAPVDMAALAHAAAEEIRQESGGEAIEIAIETLLPAMGDRTLLRQVFVNLLSNAAKFSRPKGRAEIEVGSQASDTGATVYYVKDHGMGFDQQYADKLFGVFQRLHTSPEFEGTGVGLALVQRIIQRHGGEVWAEGKPDEGATFYFSLPRRQDKKGP
jgi:PAS domain S-box-containing protein